MRRRAALPCARWRAGAAGPPGVEWVQGDLHDRAALARLVAGAEAVIHVAGVVNTPDPAELPAPMWMAPPR
jgi:uncharacterized protein YbjT (DUF2867 family)